MPKARKATKNKQPRGKNVAEAGLKPNQVLVLCALLQGKEREEAAQAGGVTVAGVKHMLGIPAFKAAYEKGLSQVQKKARIDADGLIAALIPAATCDIRTFFTGDNLKPISEWTEDMGRAVSSIEFEAIWEGQGKDRKVVGELAKIKLWPKTEAVDKLAKLLGAYTAKKHDVRVGVVIVPAKTPAPESRPPIEIGYRRPVQPP